MQQTKIFVLLLTLLLVFALAACGAKNGEEAGGMGGEPKNAEEAAARLSELMAEENEILGNNTELWEKVFKEADKGMAMIEDGKNYGEFLLDTIEAAKEQFTDEEYKLIKAEAQKIAELEKEMTMLEEKYPEIGEQPSGGSSQAPTDGSAQKFPAFEGKDLDGNDVKSDTLFSEHAVTLVNFWFTTCGPCVEELGALDALNKELQEKDGALVGVNTFTLDGTEKAIAEAKEVLKKKGASYQNVYFDSESDAGTFATGVYAYPTTYVVDREGNLVGDPIVGAITEPKQKEALQKLIDQAIADDQG